MIKSVIALQFLFPPQLIFQPPFLFLPQPFGNEKHIYSIISGHRDGTIASYSSSLFFGFDMGDVIIDGKSTGMCRFMLAEMLIHWFDQLPNNYPSKRTSGYKRFYAKAVSADSHKPLVDNNQNTPSSSSSKLSLFLVVQAVLVTIHLFFFLLFLL
ncbi:hypothetical protein MtrunA17_Chr3g0077741 [Medicago truncatula]|uniref:Transmembrane protein n=1 Tax=Medicago truncatula TaxID=3880 RepID=A0A396IQP6_MEDTR|nr:hypothetical protein MtrunA17_Chr3g0077741 [Medicago truncatula]